MNTATKTPKKYITLLYQFSNSPKGTPLGSSDMSGPYTFLCGSGEAIPGLEERVASMREQESSSFVIPSEKAYGKRDESLVVHVPKQNLPSSLQLKEGVHIHLNNTPVVITRVMDDYVVVDGNHPLAGLDLYFSVTVQSIRSTPPSSSCCCSGCDCHTELKTP